MRAALLIPVVVVLAGAGCVFGTFDDLTMSGASRPAPERCGECHREIYAEWSGSAHALAYTRESFTTASSNHEFEDCLPCHAPDSLYAPGELRSRSTDPHHGVDCVACHLDGDAMVGPLPSSAVVSPHEVRRDRESYRHSDMCGRCHEGTFAQWEAAGDPSRDGDEGRRKRECQECHMPLVTRKVTQADDMISSVLVALEGEQPQRRHRFDLAALQGFPDAAEVRARATPEGLAVAVENLLPHALPTGDFGPSGIEARITFFDAGGAPIGDAVLSWSGHGSRSIPAQSGVTRVVRTAEGAVRCEIVLLRPGSHENPDIVLARGEAVIR